MRNFTKNATGTLKKMFLMHLNGFVIFLLFFSYKKVNHLCRSPRHARNIFSRNVFIKSFEVVHK